MTTRERSWRFGTRMGTMLGLATFAVAGSAQGVSFRGIGDLAGGETYSQAWGVSGDGRVVVGTSYSADGRQATRWDVESGLQGLGILPGGGVYALGRAASQDGSVVVGITDSALSIDSHEGVEAFRWDAVGGLQSLGDLPGGEFESMAFDVTPDGTYVVGSSSVRTPDHFADPQESGRQPFRWDAVNGMVALPLPADATHGGFASGVSADGRTVVGSYQTDTVEVPFIWREDEGTSVMGDFPADAYRSEVRALSPDGRIAVAWVSLLGRDGGWIRWEDGVGELITGARGIPNAVDATGSIVGGDNSTFGAFIWTRETGMVAVEDFLSRYGLDVSGWEFDSIRGFSDDGRTIVGFGTNPDGFREGFVAVIPEPSTAMLLGLGLSVLATRRRVATS